MDGGKQPPVAQWGLAATASSTLVGTVVLGIFLDVQFNWMPWATLIGLAVGCVSCLSMLIRAAKESDKKSPK